MEWCCITLSRPRCPIAVACAGLSSRRITASATEPGLASTRSPTVSSTSFQVTPTSVATTALEIRRLTYADLPQVIALERRAFPTPWSLAMFVLELSKPSGICLAAIRGHPSIDDVDRDGSKRLAAYLICSRYDRVWHIMNIAVDPDHRRQGLATALLNRLLERVADAGGGEEARYTLEVRRSNDAALALYEQFGFKVAGVRTLEGRLDDVPNAHAQLRFQ